MFLISNKLLSNTKQHAEWAISDNFGCTLISNIRCLLIQGVSKVCSDFLSAFISEITEGTFSKIKYVIPYSFYIEWLKYISSQLGLLYFVLTFFDQQAIECVGSLSVSWVTFFQANRGHFFSLSSVFGVESLYVISSIMLQLFFKGFRSGEFAGQSPLDIKFGKFLWHHVWVTFEVCACTPSCTKVIAFLELNNFLSVGLPVICRLEGNGFTSFSRISLTWVLWG